MRSSFGADWAFGIRGAVESIVRRAFPSELRLWPILRTFDFEAYIIGTNYFVIVMRDKLSGVPAGPGVPTQFPFNDYPSLPPSITNVDQWLSYLTRKFNLRSDDIAMILPIHDSGRSDAAADFDMFTAEERQLWSHQLNVGISRQMAGVKVSPESTSTPPLNVTYNVTGENARVNINSTDNSWNVISSVPEDLFRQMIEAILQQTKESSARDDIERSIREMSSAYGSAGFLHSYKAFMSVFADHVQVFGPILAPYLPALAKLIA